MKKYLLIFCALFPICVSAQVYKEDFDGATKLVWEEYAEKERSALVQNGCFELQSLDKHYNATVNIKLPIDVEADDFVIKAEILVPRINDKDRFGIFFDNDSNFHSRGVLFCENRAYSGKIMDDYVDKSEFEEDSRYKLNPNARFRGGRMHRIKLESGKNKVVNIELKKRGLKFTVSINNMQVVEFPKEEMKNALFGFYTETSMQIRSFELHVDE